MQIVFCKVGRCIFNIDYIIKKFKNINLRCNFQIYNIIINPNILYVKYMFDRQKKVSNTSWLTYKNSKKLFVNNK